MRTCAPSHSLLSNKFPDLVISAVANVDHAMTVDEDSMRAIELTPARITIGSVTGATITDQCLDVPRRMIDDPDDVVLGIAQKYISLTSTANPFGPANSACRASFPSPA